MLGSHKGCPLNPYFVYLTLVFPVPVNARELALDLYDIIFLETSQSGVCSPCKQLWGKTRSCPEQSTLAMPVSYCISLCFVPASRRAALPSKGSRASSLRLPSKVLCRYCLCPGRARASQRSGSASNHTCATAFLSRELWKGERPKLWAGYQIIASAKPFLRRQGEMGNLGKCLKGFRAFQE